MMRIKTILCAGALLLTAAPAVAEKPEAAARTKDRQIGFNRHWYIRLQAGAGYTLGEGGSFGNLVSPTAALSFGRQFTPVWGLRIGASGWQARGAWVSPETAYKFNYLQGSVDATIDLAALFGRPRPLRTVSPYLFVGIGLAGAGKNGEANALHAAGRELDNIWSGFKVFAAGRLGAGVDFRLSDRISLGAELNANVLPDKFNSKRGDNADWQFNALAGMTVRLGKDHKKRTAPAAVPPPAASPAPAPVEKAPAVETAPEPAAAPAAEKAAAMHENIFYRIGSARIDRQEEAKIAMLADFLRSHPDARVEVVGYADAATGNPALNMRLSKERAAGVAAALMQAGIASDRIGVDGKGDTVQPFAGIEKNRVSICIAR